MTMHLLHTMFGREPMSSRKTARLVLLYKGNDKPEGVPSSYRPLMMLDEGGKMQESIITLRIEAHISTKGGLSKSRYRFTPDRSTNNAVFYVQEATHTVCSKSVECAWQSVLALRTFSIRCHGSIS